MVTVVLVALSSAAFFAVGSALQHRSAGSAPTDSKRRMVRILLRRPGWLVGAGLCATAFALHAAALSLGDLSVVQPIILSGIVFAVFARSVIDRRLPSRGELGWAVVTWVGLALFIGVLRPSAPQAPDESRTWVVVGCGLGIAAVLALLARRRRGRPLVRGVLLATASGILFGLVAGLLKLSTGEASHGVLHLLSRWTAWALIGVGVGAILLNQRAYQATRLSVSTPVLNICQLVVSLTFGLVVFRERLFTAPLVVLAEVSGLAIMVLGVTRLAGRAAARPGIEPEKASGDDTEVGAPYDDADAKMTTSDSIPSGRGPAGGMATCPSGDVEG